MTTCTYCGGELIFRYVDGVCTPIHLSGGCYSSSSRSSYSNDNEDFCRPTKCPRCGDIIYFVRHNGGSVYFDYLGWPWPKHACFDDAHTRHFFAILMSLPRKESNFLLAKITAAETLAIHSFTQFTLTCIEYRRIDVRVPTLLEAFRFVGDLVMIDESNRKLIHIPARSARSIGRVNVSGNKRKMPLAEYSSTKPMRILHINKSRY
jgi:hypothetical protein